MTSHAGAPSLELKLLRSFELSRNGEPLPLPLGPQRLLAFLALQGRPLMRDYVAGRLWIDYTEERSHANLRSALWRLRRTGSDVVTTTVNQVCISEAVEVDVRRVIRASRRALDRSAEPRQLVDDLGDDLLPDWYDDWVEIERERLRQLRLHALEAVAERLLGDGRYGQAADAGLTAIQCEPLRDSAHRLLIKVHLAEGNTGAAVRQYEIYTRRLREELGLEPSAQMRELVKDIV